ncbi:TRAF3-interacting protein 1-like isoform X2 [Corythoichthys intestinalis]|uniref:TRAF3-interacting protein 1-like isoform X2 n=1 Tax=Corythoichthys intestinalis TaxID=161448 RepID=UPI0025A58E7D|nr:TRAF3-interacting protein 1-like isoform X2 [Corythoichthys intestinalis]XP_061799529.1 TRAF3-interacting protein 1-like [Nerophis lumbriciformis]
MATINNLIIKKTQSTLGKVIKKPALTEKLLSKPPFRYLHDIFTEVIRTTGFMKGLYRENELKSECIKDKEMKMAFLQKAIDVVVLVSGEPLSVRPAQIVAGHEPEKTNELLQAIAKCCLNKMSSKEAVKAITAGEKLEVKAKERTFKAQDKENLEGRECHTDKPEKRLIEHTECRSERDHDPPREQERQRREPEREHRRDRERSAKNRHREQDNPKDGDQEDKSHERDKEKDDAQSIEKEKSQEKESHKTREKEREKAKGGERERHKSSLSWTTSPTRNSQSSAARGQRRKNTIGDESDCEGDHQQTQSLPNKEGGDTAGSSLPPEAPPSRNSRPSSARQGPPRVKKQESFTEVVPADRLSSVKSSVIRDGKKLSDDEDEEDEQFLVAEAAPEPADTQEKEAAQDLNSEEKHGGLVKKILETKKDYEGSPSSSKSKEKSEESRKQDQDLVTREIERLRASIQSVCQSALPLGKIMDYVQEDIDAMQAELQSWRKENKEHAQALMQEQKATDLAVEPLKAELGELDQQMKDYQDKICAVQSNILMNEENIQKKLAAIISPRS